MANATADELVREPAGEPERAPRADEPCGEPLAAVKLQLRPRIPAEHWRRARLALSMDLAELGQAADGAPIARIVAGEVSVADFARRFGGGADTAHCLPALIERATEGFAWPAAGGRWELPSLVAELGAERAFEVQAMGDFGTALCAQVPIGQFAEYAATTDDDNPLYLFCPLLDGVHADLLARYSVLPYFSSFATGVHLPDDQQDLFSAAADLGSGFGLHR